MVSRGELGCWKLLVGALLSVTVGLSVAVFSFAFSFFGRVPSICILLGSPASAAALICWICAIRLPKFLWASDTRRGQLSCVAVTTAPLGLLGGFLSLVARGFRL